MLTWVDQEIIFQTRKIDTEDTLALRQRNYALEQNGTKNNFTIVKENEMTKEH